MFIFSYWLVTYAMLQNFNNNFLKNKIFLLIFIKYFVDKEDYDSVALEGIDLENFDDPYPYVPLEVSYFNIQDE